MGICGFLIGLGKASTGRSVLGACSADDPESAFLPLFNATVTTMTTMTTVERIFRQVLFEFPEDV